MRDDRAARFFDVRLADGLPTAAVRAAAKAHEEQIDAAAIGELRALVQGLRIDRDELLGGAGWVGSPLALLSPGVLRAGDPRRPGGSAREALGVFLARHAGVFEVGAPELNEARVTREFATGRTGAQHLTLQQQWGGVDMFGCELRASVTPVGGIVGVACTMLPREAIEKALAGEERTGEVEALMLAMAHAGVVMTEVPALAGASGLMAGESTWATPDLRSNEPTSTRRVYFPLSRELIHPAWLVVVPAPGEGHTYDVVIDGVDGALLRLSDRLVRDSTLPVTYRVFTRESPTALFPGRDEPDGFQPAFVVPELVTVLPAEITPYSPDGWIPDAGSSTVGNNVDAHLDLNNDNVADLPRPSGGPSRVFDFPFDPAAAPSANRSLGVTQGFYLANRFHDRLYAMGFDEASGNFQTGNFGRGGVGGDAIQLDCFDGSGTNNANFNGSGVDGTSARVQMYVWTGPTPDRDGALDATLVFHELAHGLSIRLHGGLENIAQSGGLGEGWSDFFGLSLCARPGDDPRATYPMSGYVARGFNSPAFAQNSYFGIRRYPYSTSFGRNPLTLADIDPGQIALPAGVPVSPAYGTLALDAAEVHNAGEVWCSALWQARAELHERLGTGGGANDAMMRLVVDAMKLSASSPTFVQARDALLAAELLDSRGALADALWTGFALRGMGMSAAAPRSSTTTGVVEDYTAPRTVIWTYPEGVPSLRAPGTASTFRFTAAPVGVQLGSGADPITLNYAIDDGSFTAIPVEPTGGPGEYRASLPASACGSVVRYYLAAETSEGVKVDPPGAPLAARRATGGSESLAFSDDFERDMGWTIGPETAGEGHWERADPVGYSNGGRVVQPADDHTPGAGTSCYVTGRSFFQQLTYGRTLLNSPRIDLSGALDAQVSYWRWYVNGAGMAPYVNRFVVEVSVDDGGTWTTAEVVGPGSAHDPNVGGGWRFASWRLSTLGLAPSATTRVRFTAENAMQASFIFAGIDDFAVTTVACVPPCRADVNGDGRLDPDDLADFIACFFALPACAASDWDGDGAATPDDLADFIAVYFAGCP